MLLTQVSWRLCRKVCRAAEEAQGKSIDAHSHIWSTDLEHYPLAGKLTVNDLNPPSFTDDELMAIARPEGVGRVVLIQHSVYHLFDNSYLIDAVRRNPSRYRIWAWSMISSRSRGGDEKAASQGVTGFRITPFIRTGSGCQMAGNAGDD